MRNTIISAICVSAVILYSIFTSIYINDFSNQINTELSLSVNISDVNVDNINNIYNEKKKILDIIINRDHLEEFEDIIINLQSAVKPSGVCRFLQTPRYPQENPLQPCTDVPFS